MSHYILTPMNLAAWCLLKPDIWNNDIISRLFVPLCGMSPIVFSERRKCSADYSAILIDYIILGSDDAVPQVEMFATAGRHKQIGSDLDYNIEW